MRLCKLTGRLLYESANQLIVMLFCRLTVCVADLQEGRHVGLKPFIRCVCVHVFEESRQQALASHTISKARLILRHHVQELVDEQLRIRNIIRVAQPQQHVDLVDAGEIARIRPAIFVQPNPVWFVIGPNAVEKSISIEQAKQLPIDTKNIVQRIFCNSEQVQCHRMGNAQRQYSYQGIGRALERKNRACIVFQKYPFSLKRRKTFVCAIDRMVVRRQVAGREPGCNAQ